MNTPKPSRISRGQSLLARAMAEHLAKRTAASRAPFSSPLAALRHHVSGAIERGEAVAIVEIPAPHVTK